MYLEDGIFTSLNLPRSTPSRGIWQSLVVECLRFGLPQYLRPLPGRGSISTLGVLALSTWI